MDIGERIKLRREELNMSQAELARKVGYTSRSTITRIERDGNGISQDKIVAIAKALKVTPSYLMGWEDEDVALITGEQEIILEKFFKLTPEHQQILSYFMDSLLEKQKG